MNIVNFIGKIRKALYNPVERPRVCPRNGQKGKTEMNIVGIGLSVVAFVLLFGLIRYVFLIATRITIVAPGVKKHFGKLDRATTVCLAEFHRIADGKMRLRITEMDENHIAFQVIRPDSSVESFTTFTGPEDLIGALRVEIYTYLAMPKFQNFRT